MKTVTAFLGAPRKKGYTSMATSQFLDNLKAYGDVQTEVVHLGEYNIGTCRGCKACFVRGEESCPVKDDRDLLLGKIEASDGVVFASPNYSFQVSATMKCFLDRLGFLFHRPRFHGKTFTGIVVQGIYGAGKIVSYLEFVGGGMGFNVVKGSSVTVLEPMVEKERQKMARTMAEHSRRFHQQLLKPAYPSPSLFRLMAFRASRTSMKLALGEDNRDHTYFRERGWYDSDYYYPTTLGPIKKLFGATIDRIAARDAQPRECR